MISEILPALDADTITLDFGVFLAEQARTHRVSQTAIIAALRSCIETPSQPEGTSSRHAPAAQTDEGVALSSSSVTPSPIPETSGAEAHGERNAAEQSAAVESVSLTTDGPANEGGENVDPPSPTHKDTLLAGQSASALVGETAGSAVGTGAPPSREDIIRGLFADGHKPTAREAADSLGHKKVDTAVRIAKRLGLEFLRVTPSEMGERVAKGMAKKRGEAEQKKAETTAALRIASNVPVANEPSLNLRKPMVRFYLRDRAGRYVHQSLDAAPAGGPLMTDRRVYAWFGTMAQFIGASKKWPELAGMRQAGPDQ